MNPDCNTNWNPKLNRRRQRGEGERWASLTRSSTHTNREREGGRYSDENKESERKGARNTTDNIG